MRNERGVGLVELLVGMFVGALVLLVAMGSLSFYQGAQRTSVSGNSALANAVSGMYLIGNDLRLAGLGMTIAGQIACSTLNAYYNGSTRSNGGLMAPVNIVDNNGATPDTLTVMYGDAIYSGAPATLLTSQISPGSSFAVPMSAGSQTGSVALLAVPGSAQPCTLIGVSSVDTSGTSAVVSMAPSSLYNPASPSGAYSNAVTYSTAAYFLNLSGFRWLTWSINNNVLQNVDNISGAVETIADNVVQMHAEYGVTDGVNPGINQWVRATGSWVPLTATLIPRIRAVRLAIVTRSAQPEKPVAGVCNTTTTAPISWAGSPAMSLTANANWQCYHYRVLRMVFPLKNIVWGA